MPKDGEPTDIRDIAYEIARTEQDGDRAIELLMERCRADSAMGEKAMLIGCRHILQDTQRFTRTAIEERGGDWQPHAKMGFGSAAARNFVTSPYDWPVPYVGKPIGQARRADLTSSMEEAQRQMKGATRRLQICAKVLALMKKKPDAETVRDCVSEAELQKIIGHE